jgi:hypothetical protein
MPLHFAAFAPTLSSIAKFLGTQLKDPTMRILGMDVRSRAFHKAIESFLLALQDEYQRHEILPTILTELVESSVSTFVAAESLQEVLMKPFGDTDSFDPSVLSALWQETPGPAGVGRLAELPSGFDWDVVAASYLKAVRGILSETPQLREIWLAKNADDIKQALNSIRGVAPRFSADDYRRVLIEDFGTLKLSAIRSEYDQTCDDLGVPLQSIYIQQNVKEAFPPRDLSRDYRRKLQAEGRLHSDSDAIGESGLEDPSGAYQRAPIRPIREVLAEPSCQRLVILGDPGLGKSTLLQHIALDWAQGTSTSIPFVIELRKYSSDHAQPRSFLEFMESGTWSRCHVSQCELDRYMRHREVVVMFDGLDEVFDEALRSNIVAEIIGFARDYPNAKIIVTTRVMGYAVGSANPEHFRAAGFRQLTLQDFGDAEIERFVHKWYATTILNKGEQETLAARLITATVEHTAIGELAGNPLLLTMMVLLNRRKHLPRERLKLYESCAELLVEGWDAVRLLDRSEYLTHEDKIEILQRVAYEMQLERDGLGGNMISRTRLQRVLVSALHDRNVSAPRVAAQKIVRALTERDFMLCFTGDEQFAFVHRTFLEYFCAREYMSHLANGGNKDELIELFLTRWPDDTWREVLRLICAMAGPELASTLIGQSLTASGERQGWRAIFLAADCVSEIRQVGRVDTLRSAIEKALINLLEFKAVGEDENVRDNVDAETVSVRKEALGRIVKLWPEDKILMVLQSAARNQYWVVRFAAVEALVKHRKSEATRNWLMQLTADKSTLVIQAAIHGLAVGWPDEPTRELLLAMLASQDEHIPRSNIITELSQHWPEQTTWQWLADRAALDLGVGVTHNAVEELARRWRNDATMEWLIDRMKSDKRKDVRRIAAKHLAVYWQCEGARKQMLELASQHENPGAQDAALIGLARLRSEAIRRLIMDQISTLEDPNARQEIIGALVWVWGDEITMEFLLTCATQDKDVAVRQTAIHELTRHWRGESTHRLLLGRGIEVASGVRIQFLHELVRQWKDDRTRRVLAVVAEQSESAEVQGAARETLATWQGRIE